MHLSEYAVKGIFGFRPIFYQLSWARSTQTWV
jgi:hypothetical protein